MRFRFCGDLDCPDWVLSEIITMSRLTSIKMKLLCQVVMASLLGDELDQDKAKKLTSDAKFDQSDLQGAVAALGFILRSASRYGVDSASLDSELQQLGLPRELAAALAKTHTDNNEKLSNHLSESSLRLSTLKSVSCAKESIKLPNNGGNVPVNTVRLNYLDTDRKEEEVIFTLSQSQLQSLVKDLKTARSKMEELSTE
ncbi:COMM domain-containing protein 4 isoform X1 [Neocloeon triangulifer]|uniref:COMM domain-containing protein 4 isoform X1 n=1 Tax=Neocloeon triangulifer TaxID=2078957 RepID=UPI00286EEDA0|nr:COMM domain-containing protein 4 isoform X1 [Neocloeon triangulifer]